ncbi:MAG: GNAT family N-acetyltransferase [Candidatus Gracilibacteria bacterium]|nr:GNAT family N-acetyltransferase [Candidatus Gracilibacteria bacterium]
MNRVKFIKLEVNNFDKLQDYMNRLSKYEIENLNNIFLKTDWVFTEEGKKGIKEILKDKNSYSCLMKDGEEEVGYFIGKINKPKYYETSGNFCELDNFYINKEFRGKGYGKMLMQKFINWGKSNNILKFYIPSVAFLNENAKGFYKKMGYKNYSESFYIID